MSSIYRDIAQQMESIYKDIARVPLEELSKEELIQLLEGVKEEAKSSYISYSLHLGWYDNYEMAEKELTEEGEEEEYQFNKENCLAYQFEVTNWIAKQKGLTSTEITALLVQETEKAYSVFITNPIQDTKSGPIWLPKSQVKNAKETSPIQP